MKRATAMTDLYVHYRPENGLPKQIKQRQATLADLREVLLDLGAIPIGTSLLLMADVLEETE